jgi:hypothetical protein
LDFTLNYEENCFGGILNWGFSEFWAGAHVGLLRRGGDRCCFGGIYLGELPGVNGVTYLPRHAWGKVFPPLGNGEVFTKRERGVY